MTIANASTVLSADVTGAYSTPFSQMSLQNRVARLGWNMAFRWDGLVAANSPPLYQRTTLFVMPSNVILEALSVSVINMDGTTTALLEQDYDVTKVNDPPLAFMGLQASATGVSGGTVKAPRLVLNNARSGRVRGTLIRNNPVFRVIPRGTPMRVVVTTTNTLNVANQPPVVLVTLALRTPWERG